MSNPRAKALRSKVKTIRQGGTYIRTRINSSKKHPKPFKLQWREIKPRFRDGGWYNFKKYRSLKVAMTAHSIHSRKFERFEFRIVKNKKVLYPKEINND